MLASQLSLATLVVALSLAGRTTARSIGDRDVDEVPFGEVGGRRAVKSPSQPLSSFRCFAPTNSNGRL